MSHYPTKGIICNNQMVPVGMNRIITFQRIQTGHMESSDIQLSSVIINTERVFHVLINKLSMTKIDLVELGCNLSIMIMMLNST